MFWTAFLNIQLKAMQNIIKYVMHFIFKFLIGPYFSKLKWLNCIYKNSSKKKEKKRKKAVSITLMRIEFWGTPP